MKYGFLFLLLAIGIASTAVRVGPWGWLLLYPAFSFGVVAAAYLLSIPGVIHCAQGHGRTGLVAAAVLVVFRRAQTVSEAIAMVQTVRPGIELNTMQRSILEQVQ